jgi:tRNA-dihydrouridine synthase 3
VTSLDSPFAGKLWLAPLTVGGNLPFRRLAVEMGAEVTVSEMAVARRLLADDTREFALLRSHPSEPLFGVQLAGRDEARLAEAARIAEARGARFVDLNCGCPIHAFTGRGLGASLLQRPARLGRLVGAMRAAVGVPVTVKVRTGWTENEPNVSEVARVCEEAGASALTIHGRSREQRYSRAADWGLIARVAAERTIPVVGNGDVLTHYEARERWRGSGVASLMLGRGALIKPWLFREIREDRSLLLSAEERVGVLYRFVELLRDHFGVEDRGRRRAHRFLAWHLDFFARYRPLPEEEFAQEARRHPLIHRRSPLGEGLASLEALLRDPRSETHGPLADALLDSSSVEDAVVRLGRLAESLAPPPEAEAAALEPAEAAG